MRLPGRIAEYEIASSTAAMTEGNEMDFMELAQARYSVRRFDERPVEREKLDQVLEAGRLAPTAVDYQPQRILVFDGEDNRQKVKESTKFGFNAPVYLLVCYDRNESWKRADGCDYGPVDCAIVVTHMMLAAASLDLGTTFVGDFDSAAIAEQFCLPPYLEPVALLPLGYKAENNAPAPMHTRRKDLSETVHYGTFDGIVPAESNAGRH